MDYISFSRKFFAATGIPVNLLLEGRPVYSSIAEIVSYMPDKTWTMHPPTRNPEFSSLSPDIVFGHVKIENTDYDLFIGPVFTVPVDETLIRLYYEQEDIPAEYREQVSEMLYNIPVGSHAHFMRYLSFIHLCLNEKDESPDDYYKEDESDSNKRSRTHLEASVNSKENEIIHDSYEFELKLYHHIASGNVSALKKFLDNAPAIPQEGKMAHTPLRQAKNIFLGLLSKVSVLGAIPGGVDVERTYQLVDLYSQECELMRTVNEVHRLQYIMLMDFCQRAGDAQNPEGISSEIYRCMTYIKNHTNEPISVEDVAEQIGRSSSYLMRRFKEEVGMQVGAYVTKCKLEEACELLAYSDRSLSEISAYLGYSSQSYFQNVFKKQYGITPRQYRNEQRKIL